MSHFYILTLVSQDSIGIISSKKEIENKVGDLMQPYDENMESEEHEEACSCGNDPKCGECKGTGIYKSTYNPNSKWDWYSIGGR
jgi:hypothetical protein